MKIPKHSYMGVKRLPRKKKKEFKKTMVDMIEFNHNISVLIESSGLVEVLDCLIKNDK